jgi:uncharacterized protein
MRFPSSPLLILASVIAPQAAMAFNCTGVTLPSSIVICSDPDLTRLADERQQFFNEARSRLTPDQQSALWEDQKYGFAHMPQHAGFHRTIPHRSQHRHS